MGMDGSVRSASLSEATSTISDATLEEARYGLARELPHRSARRVFHYTQLLAIGVLVAGFLWALQRAPAFTLGATYVLAFLTFSAATLIRLFAAASLSPTLFRLAAPSHFQRPTPAALPRGQRGA